MTISIIMIIQMIYEFQLLTTLIPLFQDMAYNTLTIMLDLTIMNSITILQMVYAKQM
ncbi:hypothetical protein C1646_686456 [Rhizophagus diaphanus]|nr:hypothetical protein C1646_686456 [Rhizophagus diaphanus] [Rhizophagus sp. MUCL 43196]